MELHRQAGASWVAQRVPDADAAKLIVTNGAQHAISVWLSTLASRGDVILTEALTYPAFRAAAEHLELQVRGVEMDDDGIRVDAFRRAAIARIAREFGVLIIEDDVYGILCDVPAVRLSLTAAIDRDSLEHALERVARLLELGPRASTRIL